MLRNICFNKAYFKHLVLFLLRRVVHQGMIPAQSFGGSTDSKHLKNERFPLGEPYSFKAKLQPIYSNTSSERIEFLLPIFCSKKIQLRMIPEPLGAAISNLEKPKLIKINFKYPKAFSTIPKISSNIKKKLMIKKKKLNFWGINHHLSSPRKKPGFPSWDGKGGRGCEAFGGGTSTGPQPGAT